MKLRKVDVLTFFIGLVGVGLVTGGIACFSPGASLIFLGGSLMWWSYAVARG
ncbi:hypothetical protein LIN78_12050 [Leeia sp. TBRC 13508]|uniref:NADH dehydrogenase subunit 6 n=1 Tax=Leeia speluncae TaxID=2884804 RepID=A0ABS8D816_9NEIS|nr:hypothetical protein [Leeia speluncae]MCB6184277.1 hypothetical protein [Leeia speluncae]